MRELSIASPRLWGDTGSHEPTRLWHCSPPTRIMAGNRSTASAAINFIS